MISHLNKFFGPANVKQLYYFSDGAGSQYKNKYNFINLCYHEEEFGVKVEWNFFASSHGKGACDGLGGTIKRFAKKESLQRVNLQRNRITSPKTLFDWAVTFFKNISFDFCTKEEHTEHDKILESRYLLVKTVPETQKFHSICPIHKLTLKCKIFSNDTNSVNKSVTKKPRKRRKR